jgi:uncharacterized protein (TIGR02996 family)
MAGEIESDEAALQRAVQAAPADDAPWLVYTDWLEEHGRGAEAAALRQFLPDVQAAIRAGHDVSAVMTLIARHGPGTSGWGLPAPPPARPSHPRPEAAAEGTAGRQRDPSAHPMLIAFLASLVLGLFRVGFEGTPPRQLPAPRGGDGPVTVEALAEAQRLAKAREERAARPVRWPGDGRPAGVLPSAEPWDSAELVGYTLRLEDDGSVLTFTFAANGIAKIRQGLKGGFVIGADGRWWIDRLGDLNVVASDGRWLFLLTKAKVDGNRYEVTRGGRSEVFVRE